MELKEFIKATITAIAESVEELNNEIADKVVVNPKHIGFLDESYGRSDKLVEVIERNNNNKITKGYIIQDVEFNLVITEVKKNEKGTGLSIEVFNAKINTKKGTENTNTVKFSIPVAFKN